MQQKKNKQFSRRLNWEDIREGRNGFIEIRKSKMSTKQKEKSIIEALKRNLRPFCLMI